ncbi:MAG: hypothetical protein ACUVSP_10730 [Desulfotomaculales bacterium]
MQERRIALFAFVLVIALLSGWFNPLNSLELTVSPVLIELRVVPEKTVEGTILVSSRGDKEIRIRASAGDWTLRPNGEVEFLPAGQQPRSLNRWLTVYPLEFTVGRGKGQNVRYRLKPPAEITGTYWGMLFLLPSRQQLAERRIRLISLPPAGSRFPSTPPPNGAASATVG